MSTADSWGWPWRKDSGGIGDQSGFTDPGSPKGSEESHAIETRSLLTLTTARSDSMARSDSVGGDRSPHKGSMAGDVGHLLQKQSDFERQMQTADLKQSELHHLQWGLLREQLGGLAREMAGVRRDVDALRHACSRLESSQATTAKENARTIEGLEQQKAQRDTNQTEFYGQVSSVRSELATANEDRARLHLALQRLDNQVSPQLTELRTLVLAEAQERAALRDIVFERCEERLSELRGLCEQDREARQGSVAEARSASEAAARELRECFGSLSADQRAARAECSACVEKLQEGLIAEVEQRKWELSAGFGEQREAQSVLAVQLQEQLRQLDGHVRGELARQQHSFDSLEAKLRVELSEVTDTHDAGLAALRSDLSHERLHSALEGLEARVDTKIAKTCQHLEMQSSSLSEWVIQEVQSCKGESSTLQSASITSNAALEATEARLREEISDLSDEHHTARKGLHVTLLDLNVESRKELDDHRALMQEQLERDQDEHRARLFASLEVAEAKLRAEMTRASSEHERHLVELRELFMDTKSRSQALQATERVQVIASLEASEVKFRAEMSCLADDFRATSAEQRGMISKHELAMSAQCSEVQDQLALANSRHEQRLEESLEALEARSRNELGREASRWQTGHESLHVLVTASEQGRSDLASFLQQDRVNVSSLTDRLDEFQRRFKDNVAQIHVNQEANTMQLQELVKQVEKRSLFREDFDKEAKRMWEAIDSHGREVPPPPQLRREHLGVPAVQVTSPHGRGGKQSGKLEMPTRTPTGSAVLSAVPVSLERHRVSRALSPVSLSSHLGHGTHNSLSGRGQAGSVRLPSSPTLVGQTQRSASTSVLPGSSSSLSASIHVSAMTPPVGGPPPKFGCHSNVLAPPPPVTLSGARQAEPEKVTCGPARYSGHDAQSAT